MSHFITQLSRKRLARSHEGATLGTLECGLTKGHLRRMGIKFAECLLSAGASVDVQASSLEFTRHELEIGGNSVLVLRDSSLTYSAHSRGCPMVFSVDRV